MTAPRSNPEANIADCFVASLLAMTRRLKIPLVAQYHRLLWDFVKHLFPLHSAGLCGNDGLMEDIEPCAYSADSPAREHAEPLGEYRA
jgi:hypothetical protein